MNGKIVAGALAVVGLFALVWWGAGTDRGDAPSPSPSPTASARPSPTRAPVATSTGGVFRDAVRPVADAGIAALPSPTAARPPPPDVDEDSPLRGIETRELTAKDRAELKLPERLWGGVVVTKVDPTSPAAEARLAPDDVIFRAQGHKILSMDDLVRAVGERGQTRIQAYRRGAAFEVVLHKPFVAPKE